MGIISIDSAGLSCYTESKANGRMMELNTLKRGLALALAMICLATAGITAVQAAPPKAATAPSLSIWDDLANATMEGLLDQYGKLMKSGNTDLASVIWNQLVDWVTKAAVGTGVLQKVTGFSMEPEVTLIRGIDNDYFTKLDKDNITWGVNENPLFTIDKQTGLVTFKPFGTSYAFSEPAIVTAYISNLPVGMATVRAEWNWWQWILVVLAFGWLYL